jgi:hypothetical protein
VAFRAYAPFPTLLQFFKCILDTLFFEDVQHRLRFCPDHLDYVKMAAFSIGEREQVVWVGNDDYFVFGKNSPGGIGSVRRCIVTMQQPVLSSPKVRGEVYSHFHAVAVKRHNCMRKLTFCPARANPF